MFDGKTYDPKLDKKRLTTQLDKVWVIMQDGGWHSLGVLVEKCGGTEASISARIRDLRKLKFGGHTVNRRRIANGLFVYQLEVKQ